MVIWFLILGIPVFVGFDFCYTVNLILRKYLGLRLALWVNFVLDACTLSF